MNRFARIALPALGALLLASAAQAQITPPARVPTKLAPSHKDLDTNGDGRVSLEEVMAYATKRNTDLHGFYIKDVDANGDGKLTQQELNAAGVKGLEGHDVINLKDLDKNGDGYVSREELEAHIRQRYANEFHRADADADGVLHPREFAIFRF